uniref:Uncharacterized protein n=1 Tax=Timema monikensis TaxID=170555 RepID=A0A7R9ELA2_9NEOP|nr:unnamed protein product [Timema monikensis]
MSQTHAAPSDNRSEPHEGSRELLGTLTSSITQQIRYQFFDILNRVLTKRIPEYNNGPTHQVWSLGAVGQDHGKMRSPVSPFLFCTALETNNSNLVEPQESRVTQGTWSGAYEIQETGQQARDLLWRVVLEVCKRPATKSCSRETCYEEVCERPAMERCVRDLLRRGVRETCYEEEKDP